MRLPTWIGSKTVIGLLIIALLGVGYMQIGQYRQRAVIQREIDNLAVQQNELEGKNREIADSLELLNDPVYRDKVAKEQLNLKKEGEIVINFPAQFRPLEQTTAGNTGETNPQKWWHYFFYNQ